MRHGSTGLCWAMRRFFRGRKLGVLGYARITFDVHTVSTRSRVYIFGTQNFHGLILRVGRTHIIVRLQTRTRRKDGTENFGGFVYVLDGFLRDFCCGFLFARLISVSFSGSLSRLPRRGLPRPTALFSGYHAEGYHAHTDAFKLTGYHVYRVTTPELPRSK